MASEIGFSSEDTGGFAQANWTPRNIPATGFSEPKGLSPKYVMRGIHLGEVVYWIEPNSPGISNAPIPIESPVIIQMII